jgi:hypothetical protein
MKHFILIAWLAVLLAIPAARAGESPDGAWVVRLESPFAKEQPQWMPLRIDLEIADGKPVQAVASGIHLNLTWHPVDVTGLRLADGHLTGSLAVTFQSDDNEKAAIVASANAAKAVGRLKDRYADLPAQVIAVDIPLGTITGAAPGTAKIGKDVLQRDPKPLTVAARAPSCEKPSRRWRSGGDWLVFRRNRCLSPAVPGCRKRQGNRDKGNRDRHRLLRSRSQSLARHVTDQGNRDRHRLLRSRSQSLARHLPNCLGETPGPGG